MNHRGDSINPVSLVEELWLYKSFKLAKSFSTVVSDAVGSLQPLGQIELFALSYRCVRVLESLDAIAVDQL